MVYEGLSTLSLHQSVRSAKVHRDVMEVMAGFGRCTISHGRSMSPGRRGVRGWRSIASWCVTCRICTRNTTAVGGTTADQQVKQSGHGKEVGVSLRDAGASSLPTQRRGMMSV